MLWSNPRPNLEAIWNNTVTGDFSAWLRRRLIYTVVVVLYSVVVVARYLQFSSLSVVVQHSDSTVQSMSLHRVETGQPTSSSRRSDVIYRTSGHRSVVGGRQRRPVAVVAVVAVSDMDALVVVRRYELPASKSSSRLIASDMMSDFNRRVVITDDRSVVKRNAVFITNAACLVDPSTRRPDRNSGHLDSPLCTSTPGRRVGCRVGQLVGRRMCGDLSRCIMSQ